MYINNSLYIISIDLFKYNTFMKIDNTYEYIHISHSLQNFLNTIPQE